MLIHIPADAGIFYLKGEDMIKSKNKIQVIFPENGKRFIGVIKLSSTARQCLAFTERRSLSFTVSRWLTFTGKQRFPFTQTCQRLLVCQKNFFFHFFLQILQVEGKFLFIFLKTFALCQNSTIILQTRQKIGIFFFLIWQ